MKFSIPFLAKDETQLIPPGILGNEAVEAVLFDRADLDDWEGAWKTIKKATKFYGHENVSFHFPVNDSDYVADPFVAHRLKEALQRATDLGLHGVVVHSNRIRLLEEWPTIDVKNWQQQVADKLIAIRAAVSGNTWLALENMPIMDNYGIEIDPLFVFPSDFHILKETSVGVIWDLCHFTSTLANLQALKAGRQKKEHYPNIQEVDLLDFVEISDQIVHWHFSAFQGVANPQTGEQCKEGVLPSKSELGEEIYATCISKVMQLEKPAHLVFEIQEDDYSVRTNALEMIRWANCQMSLQK
ncbi:MAG: hypothetical protein S4CHLAM45_07340 [Chlamydiales bacterium]|nr:hypothetical protein [Chlamydiales bacterium]MCH9620249.1 hypothetical protein [Chlamydiales bacterium]MCH9622841.1 hypothetical protein [Chlamydiales bacterium]